MATITEDYVSFEVAKLLKEKGFNQKCTCFYFPNRMQFAHTYGEILPKDVEIYESPTQAMTMRWLRETHNIHIGITPFDIELRINGNIVRYIPEIYTKPTNGHELCVEGLNIQDTYEEACEAAIKYCLENLI